MNMERNILPVRTQDVINFHCRQCGRCCRHVKDSVMVTPLDAFRLAKFLNNKGHRYADILELYTLFCEPIVLTEEGYSIFVLKTKGPEDACIFLEGDRCTVYGAHPYTCRLYPFTVEYGHNGRDFAYFLCTELPHQPRFAHLTRSADHQWFSVRTFLPDCQIFKRRTLHRISP